METNATVKGQRVWAEGGDVWPTKPTTEAQWYEPEGRYECVLWDASGEESAWALVGEAVEGVMEFDS